MRAVWHVGRLLSIPVDHCTGACAGEVRARPSPSRFWLLGGLPTAQSTSATDGDGYLECRGKGRPDGPFWNPVTTTRLILVEPVRRRRAGSRPRRAARPGRRSTASAPTTAPAPCAIPVSPTLQRPQFTGRHAPHRAGRRRLDLHELLAAARPPRSVRSRRALAGRVVRPALRPDLPRPGPCGGVRGRLRCRDTEPVGLRLARLPSGVG